MKYEEITLSNMSKGSAEELFQYEMREVIRNIRNPNTSDGASRKITIELDISPDVDGDGATVKINCKSKLASVSGSKCQNSFEKNKAFQKTEPESMFDNVEPIEGNKK